MEIGQVARAAAFAVRVSSPATLGEQAHADDEISIRTKSTPQLRHGATLQQFTTLWRAKRRGPQRRRSRYRLAA